MKKLLCIIDSLNVGGAETFLMKVMRCLSEEEYQFDFIVSKAEGVYSQEVLSRGGKIYVIPPRRENLPLAFKKIRSIVKQNQYQYILRLGDEPIVGIDLLAAKLGGADRLAFRSCNALTGLSYISRVTNFFMRPILNSLTDVRIAPSTLAAEFTFGERKAKKTYIIHNGVDLNKFHFDDHGRDCVRKEFNLQGKLVVGHIGRFNKQKNHRYLLEVFREISVKRSDAVLLLIGDGEDKELIKKWMVDLDLGDKVIMAGQRFDIPALLSAMDVFIFPSLHEGMPNTVIEAQATGLPCVIADTITREADLTGLVHYLSLDDTPKRWAEKALSVLSKERVETSGEFKEKGYDIKDVAKELVDLIFN